MSEKVKKRIGFVKKKIGQIQFKVEKMIDNDTNCNIFD